MQGRPPQGSSFSHVRENQQRVEITGHLSAISTLKLAAQQKPEESSSFAFQDFIPLISELPDYQKLDEENRRKRKELMMNIKNSKGASALGICKTSDSSSLQKRKPTTSLVEIEVSDGELEIPIPNPDRSVFSKPGTDELTTTESSIRRLFSMRKGERQVSMSARDIQRQLMEAAKEKMLTNHGNVEEIEISDDDQQRREREIARLKSKIREAEAERDRLINQQREAEREKERERQQLIEREKREKEKKPILEEYPEDQYLKQLSGVYKATFGKPQNRLTELLEKDQGNGSQQESKISFASRFQVLESLGEGSSCVVRKVLCKKNQKVYAVKSCKINDATSISYIKKEFKILRLLTHPSIINTYGIFESNSNVAFNH